MDQAKDDGHNLLVPTHIVEREGSGTLGAVSLGSVPFVTLWMDSGKAKPRDSVETVNLSLHLMEQKQVRILTVGCEQTSPFYPYMPKLGFQEIPMTLHLGRTT